tara:strand:+ start:2429 stop:3163 length:735 start_codon:yes stop_codon:yes gene_type:complete
MTNVVIIPCRMASSRMPGKPLVEILKKPMITYIIENSKKARGVDETYVATCDKEIANYCKKIGCKYIMTSIKHQRATDRTYEAAIKINKKKKLQNIIMIQGDEPLINNKMIESTLSYMKRRKFNVVNMINKINDIKEISDPNCIKIALDKNKKAIFFSRLPIPSTFHSSLKKNIYYKQVCIFGFTLNSLKVFSNIKEGYIEKQESIDMFRYLESGIVVDTIETKVKTQSVDVKSDILKAIKLLR